MVKEGGSERANPEFSPRTTVRAHLAYTRPVASALSVDELTMRYRDTLATDRLSLEVETGTITAVLGPNGAGKTTTLETGVGVRRPQRGTVRTLGLDPVRDRARLLPRIGVMPQAGGAWSGVKAGEMLTHLSALYAHPLPVDLLMERLGLREVATTSFRRLSGGARQRLGLAMALVGRPELVFVDEPTAGLDPHARHEVWNLLEELRADGVTIVLTTHLIDEAERLADTVHVIDHGRLIASGSPADLIRTSARPVDGTDTDGAGVMRMSASFAAPLPVADLRTAMPGVHLRAADGRGPEEATSALAIDLVGAITPATIAGLAACAAGHDVLLVDLRVDDGRRTLEDVFLDLTGSEPTS
jgi:ABC-2 type transport system ATP-binding protein